MILSPCQVHPISNGAKARILTIDVAMFRPRGALGRLNKCGHCGVIAHDGRSSKEPTRCRLKTAVKVDNVDVVDSASFGSKTHGHGHVCGILNQDT